MSGKDDDVILAADEALHSERERNARELAAARGLFETVFESAPVGMAISRVGEDGTTEVVKCNLAFAEMLGRTPEASLGSAASESVHPDDQPLRRLMIDNVMKGRPATAELRFVHSDGHEIWVLVVPSLALGPDGETLIVVQALDISERKTFETQLQQLADRDALTGLFSRRRFEEELQREVSRARRHRRPAALLLLDLDGFKGVNDAFGHAAGDALLVRISDALREVLRETDILARIGGDEFALILPDTSDEASDVVADKLIRAVRAHGSFLLDGRRTVVTVSIGITSLNGRRGIDAAHLLSEADEAMYQAKAAGKDAFVVHSARTLRDAAA